MKEEIIVSLTTWRKRIHNIPIVLDSIYAQTYMPDKIVLNLAYGEEIPEDIETYLKKNKVEVNFLKDTKVYKKFVPTLQKYPDACVINIDDDCIFPKTMIEDFLTLHQHYPKYPISGNHVVLYGMQCHCGNASLTKAEHFGKWLEKIDEELMCQCPSSDIVYTYFATRNGHPYIHTREEYFTNVMQEHLGKNEGYTNHIIKHNGIEKSYAYLVRRFGQPDSPIKDYVADNVIVNIIENILQREVTRQVEEQRLKTENQIRQTKAYRLGKALLRPFRWLRRK